MNNEYLFFLKIGSWEENEVAGFIIFSQWLLKGYFRLGKVNVKGGGGRI